MKLFIALLMTNICLNQGPVERHFVRKFNLPHEFDMTLIKSTLSKDGILQLEAPKPQVGIKIVLSF